MSLLSTQTKLICCPNHSTVTEATEILQLLCSHHELSIVEIIMCFTCIVLETILEVMCI